MANPVNPRAPAGFGNEGQDDLRERAMDTISQMHSSYAHAISRAAPGTRLAPSKLRTPMPSGGTQLRAAPAKAKRGINVKVSKMLHWDKGKHSPAARFNVTNTTYDEDTLLCDVLAALRGIADNTYSKEYNHRVYEMDEIDLLWNASKAEVDKTWFDGTKALRDLWSSCANNKLYIPLQDVKRLVVDLQVLVKTFDPDRQNNDLETTLEMLDDSAHETKIENAGRSKRGLSVGEGDHAREDTQLLSKKP
ncbi:hypothetical protein FA15DRAFT_711970, partial [Coprinopsis marcescibilis]